MSSLLDSSSVAHQLSQQFVRTPNMKYCYGTAGFRGKANTLESICFRMGMFAALRSRCFPTSDGKCRAVGVMLTASHNPEPDNGLKIVDPSGCMLDQSWEETAADLANAPEGEVCAVLLSIAEEKKIDLSLTPHVFVGRDTRPSSPSLSAILLKGIAAFGATVTDLGIVTTPQLHYSVATTYAGNTRDVNGYYTDLCGAFRALIGSKKPTPVLIDCANGVGQNSAGVFSKALSDTLAIETINTSNTNLNHLVGADHVQKAKVFPLGFEMKHHKLRKCASVDGDADRIVYFYADGEEKFQLLDGDRIIALFATYLQGLVKQSELKLDMSVVQTAYANGASTIYIDRKLGITPIFTKTGVKHLHAKAHESDIGIYFEANGHGTVLISDETTQKFQKAYSDDSSSAEVKAACGALLQVRKLINQSCGDAFSDLLLVEVILAHRDWALSDWAAMYSDLPSRMLKVAVPDRTAVKTTNAERTCTAPQGLQAAIDQLVGNDPKRRSFVRPSGTEDVVRVYAEAATQEQADLLANEVKVLVARFCA